MDYVETQYEKGNNIFLVIYKTKFLEYEQRCNGNQIEIAFHCKYTRCGFLKVALTFDIDVEEMFNK